MTCAHYGLRLYCCQMSVVRSEGVTGIASSTERTANGVAAALRGGCTRVSPAVSSWYCKVATADAVDYLVGGMMEIVKSQKPALSELRSNTRNRSVRAAT